MKYSDVNVCEKVYMKLIKRVLPTSLKIIFVNNKNQEVFVEVELRVLNDTVLHIFTIFSILLVITIVLRNCQLYNNKINSLFKTIIMFIATAVGVWLLYTAGLNLEDGWLIAMLIVIVPVTMKTLWRVFEDDRRKNARL